MSSIYSRASHWWQHWVAGFLVPVGIYAEPAIERWFHKHRFDFGGWTKLLVIAGFYLLAVLLMWVFHELVERVRLKWESEAEATRLKANQDDRAKPISFPGVGEVNGNWIDAIFDAKNDKIIQGSTIKFDSTKATGFTVEGFSYEFDGTKLSDIANDFKATETMLLSNGIAYVYEGKEIIGKKRKPHEGAGYYEFKVSDKGDIEFEGAFFAVTEKYVRRVQGRMVRSGQAFNTMPEKKEALRIYLLELTGSGSITTTSTTATSPADATATEPHNSGRSVPPPSSSS
jgi:hypothetical protein